MSYNYIRACIAMPILVVLLLALIGRNSAFAMGGYPSIGLRPVGVDANSYFVLDGKPGMIVRRRLLAANTGSVSGTFSLNSVDALTGASSGTVYRAGNARQEEVGTWLQLGVSQLTLAPGERRLIDVVVKIPQLVQDGQHIGGIVAQLVHSSSSASISDQAQPGFGVRLNVLTILAVQVNLPGQRVEDLRASGVQVSGANRYQTVDIGLRNAGNVMLKPRGAVEIRNEQGTLLQQEKITMDTFLPRTAIDYPVVIQKKALAVGLYVVSLTLAYGDQHILHYSAPFTVTAQIIKQIFQTNNPLSAPEQSDFLASIPLWLRILAILLLLISAFCTGVRVAQHRWARW